MDKDFKKCYKEVEERLDTIHYIKGWTTKHEYREEMGILKKAKTIKDLLRVIDRLGLTPNFEFMKKRGNTKNII